MGSFLHIYSAHSLTLQLHPKCYPFSTCKALSCSSPPTTSFRTVAVDRRHARLTWVRVQRHRPAVIRLKAFFSGDGGDGGHNEDEWYAMDASQLKAFLWQALKRWGLPVAVGALVGSIIAQQAFVFASSLSFLTFMAAHKVLEAQGGHLNSVSDIFSWHVLLTLLDTTKLLVSRAFVNLPGAITVCRACLRRICMYIWHLVVTIMARLCLHITNQQGYVSQQKGLLPLEQTQLTWNITNSALGSQPNSMDTVISDINTCIQKVEGTIRGGKGPPYMLSAANWNELRDNVALLKAIVANIPLKGDGRAKTKKVDKVLTNLSVQVSQQDTMRQAPVELDIVKKIEDLSPHAYGTGKDASNSSGALAANDVALDQEQGSLSTEMSGDYFLTSTTEPLHAVATIKIGENESHDGVLRNPQQPKYVDYWTQHDKEGSASSSGFSFLVDEEEQKNKEQTMISDRQSESSVMASDQVTLRENDIKAPIPYVDKKNLWIDESQQSGLTGNSDLAKVSSRSLNGGDSTEQNIGVQELREERHEPRRSVHEFKSLDAEQMSLSREHSLIVNDETGSRKHDLSKRKSRETTRNIVENKSISSGSVIEQISTQRKIDGNAQKNHAEQQSTALLGSTKELAFLREDPDMHALTGFSRMINNEEFQSLMTEGETAFKNGKAGILGKTEVGEAETMLHKAADLFASAASMDPSSVEAFGFWGNTLLVHGELKLMLSRELRYMISSPDVISSYQIRRSRVTETSEGSNIAAALQQSFKAVCEECEELLIQAGRKYRTVLSINNSEVRALYNWGLALCFRAQLIAEGGGENAREAADRVYLAAIDKFEAMMGISRRYAPGAMLNWGLTLRDRSRLRPMGNTERIDLLRQANQLFEDALRLQPGDAQLRSAFTTCNVELKELQERKELQSKKSTRSFFGNR